MFKIAKVEKWKDFANNFVNGYEFFFFFFLFFFFSFWMLWAVASQHLLTIDLFLHALGIAAATTRVVFFFFFLMVPQFDNSVDTFNNVEWLTNNLIHHHMDRCMVFGNNSRQWIKTIGRLWSFRFTWPIPRPLSVQVAASLGGRWDADFTIQLGINISLLAGYLG